MTIPQFLRAIKKYARPKYNWIVLGDGSICIRDHVGCDPVTLLAVEKDPTYAFRLAQDELRDECRQILGLSEDDDTDLANEIAGDCAPGNPIRNQVLRALNMTPEPED